MADRPQRAIVLYGDGLLQDAAGGGTVVEASRCDTLHHMAACGASSFLALRSLPAQVAAEKRVLLELAQLLDVGEVYSAEALEDDSKATWEDLLANMEERETSLPSLAGRFMNLAGVMLSNSAPAAALAKRAGFALVPMYSGDAEDASLEGKRTSSLPSCKSLAERLVRTLGLHKEEEKGPPPNAAQRSDDEFELAMVHVEVDSLVGMMAKGGRKGGEKGEVAEIDGEREKKEKWDAAVYGIEWINDLVFELQKWAVRGSKAEAHMLIVLLLGYGRDGIEMDKGDTGALDNERGKRKVTEILDLPGFCALLPSPESANPELNWLRPRQSYRLKEDKEVADVRDHHPILALHFLRGVTRQDEVQRLGVQECRERGGQLALLADRFLHELAFKLWRAPKYGA